ncbi:MAG: ATP-binding cassette domain-containing protein [Nitrospina sp.]|mgnify:CR=1 FL=1|jgi:ABC-2 type transport system ATP-binding protein|nr:ATP-binding cassette domain-containing protein [Nitrospina sp.]MBT6600754.1 ATP-binding cassette domain-containing protein [Nitrospina sp.]
MIEVEHLSKSYGPREAVKELSFQIEKGEVVGFLGPNGAGKSTTMNILSCIMPASSGTAKICGFDIFEQAIEIRKLIGYLPETPPLYPDMVVYDFLAFAARLRNVPSKKTQSAVEQVIERCSLKEVSGRIIGRLSKGYQQRVGIAQALVHNPDILILDEPTIGLDPIQIIEIRKLIQELASSHTIILSSHILPEITQICKRVIIISDGQIAAVDSLDALTTRLRKGERLLLNVRRNDSAILEKISALEKVNSVTEHQSGHFTIDCEPNAGMQDDIAQLCLNNKWGIVELKPVSMTLEDIFLKLTLEESTPQ